MIDHKKSDGTPCAGCPPTCTNMNNSCVIGGVSFTGCCGMTLPHGPMTFDNDGNVTNTSLCCAGFDHATGKCDPSDCGGHGGKPEWSLKVRDMSIAGLPAVFAKAKIEAKTRKVKEAIDSLNDLTADEANDSTAEHAKILKNGKVFRGGLRRNEETGEVEAEAVVMEKVINPHNPDPEWHHRDFTSAEKVKVRAALKTALE